MSIALHHPVPYTWTEWAPGAPEDDPGTDHTIQVCEECRRVEVSDAVHWSGVWASRTPPAGHVEPPNREESDG